jgi:hypothetical protein
MRDLLDLRMAFFHFFIVSVLRTVHVKNISLNSVGITISRRNEFCNTCGSGASGASGGILNFFSHFSSSSFSCNELWIFMDVLQERSFSSQLMAEQPLGGLVFWKPIF